MASSVNLTDVVDDPKVALHLLAHDSSPKALHTVKFLLDSGRFDVNQREPQDGLTPLHVAAHWDNLEMCQLLIHYGADPLAFSKDEECPMDLAKGKSKKFMDGFCNKRGQKKKQRKIMKFLRHLFQPHKAKVRDNTFRSRCNSAPPYILSDVDQQTASRICEFVEKARESVENRESLETNATFVTAKLDRSPARRSSALSWRTAEEPEDGLSKMSKESASRKPSMDGSMCGSVKDKDAVHAWCRDVTPKAPQVQRSIPSPSAPPLTPKQTPAPARKPPVPAPRTTSMQNKNVEYSEIRPKVKPRKESLFTDDEDIENEPGDGIIDESLLNRFRNLELHELRNSLLAVNVAVGPLDEGNRGLYERKLARVLSQDDLNGRKSDTDISGKFSTPVNRFLTLGEDLNNAVGRVQEEQLVNFFSAPHLRNFTFFCYVLIDPRLFNGSLQPDFRQFCNSVFYVGKGRDQRSRFHVQEALMKKRRNEQMSHKSQRIVDIWDSGYGVKHMHIFNNVSEDEAFIREAALITAIDIKNLTNVRGGDLKPPANRWKTSELAELGLHQLRRIHRIFVEDRCTDIHEHNVQLPSERKERKKSPKN